MSLYSENEIVAIESLLNNLKDLNLDEYENSSEYLIRWLRARDMNIPKAEDMLRKSLKWREDENINSILSWCPPVEIQNFAKTDMCGYDNEGCPVFITTYNSSDMEAFWAYDLSVHLRFTAYKCEQAEAMLKESLKNNKLARIVDVNDVSALEFRKFINPRAIRYFGKCSLLASENYPDMFKRIHIAYAPFFFGRFLSIGRRFMTTDRLEKIKVYGSNPETFKHELFLDIPIDLLPPKFGGTNNSLIIH